MKTLVTGGAGFIGSTLVDHLIEAGHDVVTVDNYSTGKVANLDAAANRSSAPDCGTLLDTFDLDVRDAAVTDTIAAQAPDVVFHLAAQADVRVSVADPVLDAEINVIGLLRVMEGARLGGASKFVFASSGGTIYGDPGADHLPYDESEAQRPLSPYGVTKKVGGDYLAAYEDLHGLSWAALALANVYGPRQDPHGEAGVVAIFAGRLLAGEPCTIFGTGEATRDYVYVDDVARAFVLAATAGSGIYNIGTGVETSVNDLYASMARAAAVAAPAQFASARPGELDRSALDASRARRDLGWRVDTALDSGTAAVLDWFKR